MKEIWKPCPGYEKLYDVSNLGNFRTRSDNPKSRKKISGWVNYTGYRQVHLTKDGIDKYYRAHRLVAEAFISNPLSKPHVNHKDGNRSNNQVSNLEWVTSAENLWHAEHVLKRDMHRNWRPGAKHVLAKLTTAQVRWIYKNKEKMAQKDMAKKLGVARSTVADIAVGWRWTEEYKKYFGKDPVHKK